MAIICVSPHGSNMDGTRIMSDAAYIRWDRGSSNANLSSTAMDKGTEQPQQATP